jgi:hypothetical protein
LVAEAAEEGFSEILSREEFAHYDYDKAILSLHEMWQV